VHGTIRLTKGVYVDLTRERVYNGFRPASRCWSASHFVFLCVKLDARRAIIRLKKSNRPNTPLLHSFNMYLPNPSIIAGAAAAPAAHVA
jgi:hypothetical protein